MYFDFITVIPRHGNSSRYLLRLSIWSEKVGIKIQDILNIIGISKHT